MDPRFSNWGGSERRNGGVHVCVSVPVLCTHPAPANELFRIRIGGLDVCTRSRSSLIFKGSLLKNIINVV